MATKRAARGIVVAHALKHRDKKSGQNGPTTVRCRVADVATGAETGVEMAMDDSQARTDFPIGGHVEVTFERGQGELHDAAVKPSPAPQLSLTGGRRGRRPDGETAQ
jgi:hypothetical protein